MPRLKMRRKTRAEWLAQNPVLADGEPGIEKGTVRNLVKIGDGVREWKKLPYVIGKRATYEFDPRYSGPASTEITSFTTSAAADVAYNEQYAVSGNALPAIWPVDVFGVQKAGVGSNNWSVKRSNGIGTSATYRMMTDADEIYFFMYGTIFNVEIFVDGRPYANNPVALGGTAPYTPFGFNKLVFTSGKKQRLVEIRSVAGFAGIYVKKPYRVWKPPADTNPTMCVVGDSFVAPTVYQDAAAGVHPTGYYDLGIYQRMIIDLGMPSIVCDGIGGSGYIAPSGSNMPYNHAGRVQWLKDMDPDVIVMHGGGANDLYQGNSVAATITAATNRFIQLRDDHPDSKLVFVEGFAPPLFTPATFNPNYKLIREGVQANLAAAGIAAYFIDVATTRPPLNGTGYVTAPDAIPGNTNIYVGSDQVHLSVAGNTYLRGYLAAKLKRILSDNGELVGTLI